MHLSDDGKTLLCVTSSDIQEGRFIIPSTVNRIGEWAFRGCTNLTEVSIAEGVVVEMNAFESCTGLTTVNLAKGAIVNFRAFESCTGLTTVNLAEGVEVLTWGFLQCTALTDINFPEGVIIGPGAFESCRSLVRLNIPEGITIERSAFEDCSGLIELTLPKGITIDVKAFKNCTSLTKLTLPEGINVGGGAFEGCSGLTEVNIAKGATVGKWAFQECDALTTLSLPEGIRLEKTAFAGCSKLKFIIVNTEQPEELIRIKSMFQWHQGAHFIQKSVYDQVLCLRDSAYQKILNEPRVSRLYGCHQSLGLIDDILRVINVQEHEGHAAYRMFQDELNALLLPTAADELARYAQQLHLIANKVITKIFADHCIAKLNTYVGYIQDLTTQKNAARPGFFKTHPALYTKLNEQCAAVQQLIDFLRGNKNIRFSLETLNFFKQGFVGKTLTRFEIALTELPTLEPTDNLPIKRKRTAAHLMHTPLKKQKYALHEQKDLKTISMKRD